MMVQENDSLRYVCANDHDYVVTTTDPSSANGMQFYVFYVLAISSYMLLQCHFIYLFRIRNDNYDDFFYTVMLSWKNLAQKEGYFIRLGSNSRLLGVKRIGDGEALEVSILSIVHFICRYCLYILRTLCTIGN